MGRAIRWDGLLPYALPGHEWGPPLLARMRDWIADRRTLEAFDIVVEGTTPGDDRVAATGIVALWAEAGATWWIESDWEGGTVPATRRRIIAGPPREDV